MPREYDVIKGDIHLKISEPSNKNDDNIYEQVIQTLTKLPDEIVDNIIQKVYFCLMGVYGKYMKFESGFNGDRHYIFLNSIGLTDKDNNEIQAVIAHEIAHFVKGHQLYYNFIRPHQGLNGYTPAHFSNIYLGLGNNKWENLLMQSVKNNNSDMSSDK